MATAYVGVKEGTDKKIATHSFTEDGAEKHVERIALATGVLTFPATPQIDAISATGLYPATAINISGFGYVAVKSLFSENGQSCTIKLIIYDANGKIIGETSEQDIGTTGREEDTKYVGQLLIFENKIGASKVKIDITEAPPSGDISFYITGI